MDPKVTELTVGTREPYALESPARTNYQVVVGDIPALRPGSQPRPVLLAQLNRASPRPLVVLTGTSGAGKTQLAAACARARLAEHRRLIAWVNARDSHTLLMGLAAVAEAIGLSVGGSQPGTADAGQAVRHWLEADGSRCLLVFDGVEDPGLLRPFVPAAGAARVLVTVAWEPMAELGTVVPVDVFSAEEALALLDGRTGLADEAGASAVASELGHLPLVLDQAAAVIAGQHLSYAAYLGKPAGAVGRGLPVPVGRRRAAVLAGRCGGGAAALDAASAADPLGVCTGVMELMAMLSPAAVRRDLLRAAGQAGTLLGGGRRVAAPLVDQALERLDERSLLGFSLNGQDVSMHCLVAGVVRGWPARRGRLATACRAAASTLEGSAAELAKPRDHAAIRDALGQVTALLENVGASTDDADDEQARILVRLRFLALNTRNSLAAAYEDAGRLAEAIQLFEQTLAGRERLLGPGDPETMRSRNDLARAYRDAGRVADAVPLVEQTPAARERLSGADHPSTLASRNNLASAYRAIGRPSEAIPLFEKNAAACERLFGADHPKTLASRHNLDRARQESAHAENEGRSLRQD